MRRVFLSVSLAAVAVVAIAATASAQKVTKFSVIEIQKSGHRSGHSFITRGTLVQPRDRDNVVGHDVVKFTPRSRHKFKVRGIGYFRGEGSLKVKGTAGPGNNRIPIIGGTGDFNGAAGKLLTHDISHKKTRLTFIFVQ